MNRQQGDNDRVPSESVEDPGDDTQVRTGAIRERFHPGSGAVGWRTLMTRPGRMLRFLQLSLSKAKEDELPTQSAALAFITIIAIVPLMAGLSYFSAGFFTDRQDELVRLLAQILPYTEANITDRLADFLQQSRQLRGLAFFAFMITALSAFIAIERSINDIWNVTARRSLRSRVSSFVQLLLFGPILIVGTYSFAFYLGNQPTLRYLEEVELVRSALAVVPTLVTALGLTVLYWQVPNTRVRFRSALAGGVLAALLLEALHFGFGYYVEVSQRISAVYGSFGLLLLFIISVQLTWAIVLLGTEIAYCTQNYAYMSRQRLNTGVMDGAWLGLSTVLVILDRFREKKPITPHELLAERMSLSVAELRRAIEPLVKAEMLRENLGEEDGYLLSCDPYRVRVAEIFDLYEGHQWRLIDSVPEHSAEPLADLRARFTDCRSRVIGDLMLASLVVDDDDPRGFDETARTAAAEAD